MVDLLLANNVAAPSKSQEDCTYLKSSVQSWLQMAAIPQPASLFKNVEDTYVLWAQLLPVRCDFQREDGVITFCKGQAIEASFEGAAAHTCFVWDEYSPENPDDATPFYFAKHLSLRWQGIRQISRESTISNTSYYATVIYNHNPIVALA